MRRIKLTRESSLAGIATLGLLVVWAAIYMIGRAGLRIPQAVLGSQAHGLTEPVTLKIVTFNVQDIYLVRTDSNERMRAIAEELCALDPDIVGFQESFIRQGREILIEGLKECSRLQYHQYYPSRVAGSGLLISSAYPITERAFLQFEDSNPFYKVREGDWWAGKGLALARLELPDGIGFVDFYNTHAQADYGNSAYVNVRKNQLIELASFVTRSHSSTTPAFLVGDMNCRVGENDCEAAVKGANLLRLMDIDSGIDHIFAVRDSSYTFELVETARIERLIRVQGKEIPISDHSGLLSTVHVIPSPP